MFYTKSICLNISTYWLDLDHKNFIWKLFSFASLNIFATVKHFSKLMNDKFVGLNPTGFERNKFTSNPTDAFFKFPILFLLRNPLEKIKQKCFRISKNFEKKNICQLYWLTLGLSRFYNKQNINFNLIYFWKNFLIDVWSTFEKFYFFLFENCAEISLLSYP
jgi:hypothetical protein